MRLWDAANKLPANLGHGHYFEPDESGGWLPCCAVGHLIVLAGGDASMEASTQFPLLMSTYGLRAFQWEGLISANDDTGDEWRQLVVLHEISKIVVGAMRQRELLGN